MRSNDRIRHPFRSADYRSGLPQAMQVAVFVDVFHLVVRHERKSRLRLVAGLEFLALVAVLGLDGDPLDAVGVRPDFASLLTD